MATSELTQERLTGGHVAFPVRVGDTVRRPLRRWTDAVHGVLRHLERVGFEGTPRVLGTDEDGREVLAWVEGTAGSRPWPAVLTAADGLTQLGAFLRRLHEAVGSYRPDPGAEWWVGRRPMAEGHIVCHGDLTPENIVWRDGLPVGFIDWDFAEPGPPLMDLGQLAFFNVPLRDDDHCRACGFAEPPDRAARLRALCKGYGTDDPAAVVDAAESWWAEAVARTRYFGALGIFPWDGFLERGIAEAGIRQVAWLRSHRHLLVGRR